MRRHHYKLAAFFMAVFFPAVVMLTRAQELQCADTIKRILQETGDKCNGVLRNNACYGNNLVLATAKEGVPLDGPNAFVFNKAGDQASIADIGSLRLGVLDQKKDQWGVAYLRVQGNFPDSAPGQFVTMLLYGDAALEDRSKEVSAATGKQTNPMQAIYFRTGAGSPSCKGAPTSGIILQTPKGAQKAEITVNEVKLSIGSTVFIQAPDDDLPPIDQFAGPTSTRPTAPPTNTPKALGTKDSKKNRLIITTIEGSADITVGNITTTAAAGQQVEVPLVEDNSRPAAPPAPPQSAVEEIEALLQTSIETGVNNALLVPTPTSIAVAEVVSPTPNIPNTGFTGSTSTPLKTNIPVNTPVPPTAVPPTASPIPPTLSPSITVSNFNDSGPGSLRDALAYIEPGGTINIGTASPDRTRPGADSALITLTSGPLVINRSLTLTGPGAASLTISANNASRVFEVRGGTATIRALTIANGAVSDQAGAGIFISDAALTLERAVLTGNRATGTNGYGGAIFVGQNAKLNLIDSTLSNNSATQAALFGLGAFNVQGSTISGNTGDGVQISSTGTFLNSTISGNTRSGIVNNGGTATVRHLSIVFNGQVGLVANGGSVLLANTIVSGNGGDVAGTITSNSGNVIGNSAGGTGFTQADRLNVDPLLGPLQPNGGNTATHLLLPGSPAVDFAVGPDCPNIDQRGAPRPRGAGCDSGAVERDGPAPTFTPTLTLTPSNTPTITPSYTATFTNTPTNTATFTPTFTPSYTNTPTNTATFTPTYTNTPTNTATFTPTYTNTATYTSAGSITVTNLNDSGAGSFRQAIVDVAAGGSIDFGVTGTINLASPLTIPKNMTVNGPGANLLTLNGNNTFVILAVNGSTNVTVNGLTVQNGRGAFGGNILHNTGTLTLNRVWVKDGVATSQGGGMYTNFLVNTSINESLFTGNQSPQGAALNANQSFVTVTNSTFTDNISGGLGAFVMLGGSGSLTINYSTVAHTGGYALYSQVSVTISNTILTSNTGNDITAPSITSNGYNLVQNRGSSTGWIGSDLPNGTNPLLAALADNGGPTQTRAIPNNSPAYNAGNNVGCPTVDQRGIVRPQHTICDIGAFESTQFPPVPQPSVEAPVEPSVTPVPSNTPIPPTKMPTSVPTSTATSSATLTLTPQPTLTPIPSNTATATVTETATNTPIISTSTPLPTSMPLPTYTALPTFTPLPTYTPVGTHDNISIVTPNPLPLLPTAAVARR